MKTIASIVGVLFFAGFGILGVFGMIDPLKSAFSKNEFKNDKLLSKIFLRSVFVLAVLIWIAFFTFATIGTASQVFG